MNIIILKDNWSSNKWLLTVHGIWTKCMTDRVVRETVLTGLYERRYWQGCTRDGTDRQTQCRHVHCLTSGESYVVLSSSPPAPPEQDSFELKSSNQPLKEAAKSATYRTRWDTSLSLTLLPLSSLSSSPLSLLLLSLLQPRPLTLSLSCILPSHLSSSPLFSLSLFYALPLLHPHTFTYTLSSAHGLSHLLHTLPPATLTLLESTRLISSRPGRPGRPPVSAGRRNTLWTNWSHPQTVDWMCKEMGGDWMRVERGRGRVI